MEWISVENRMPEYEVHVLLLLEDGEQTVGSVEPDECGISYRIGNDNLNWDYHFNNDLAVDDITHWMPLPEPPKEVK